MVFGVMLFVLLLVLLLLLLRFPAFPLWPAAYVSSDALGRMLLGWEALRPLV